MEQTACTASMYKNVLPDASFESEQQLRVRKQSSEDVQVLVRESSAGAPPTSPIVRLRKHSSQEQVVDMIAHVCLPAQMQPPATSRLKQRLGSLSRLLRGNSSSSTQAQPDGTSFVMDPFAAGAAYSGSLGLSPGRGAGGAADESQQAKQGQQPGLPRLSSTGKPRTGGAPSRPDTADLCAGVSLIKLLMAFVLGAYMTYLYASADRLLHGEVSAARPGGGGHCAGLGTAGIVLRPSR